MTPSIFGPFWAADEASAPDVGPLVTVGPSVSPGAPATVGVQQTGSIGTYAARGGGTVTTARAWLLDGVSVGTGATYTPGAGDAGKTLEFRVIATETGGTAAGSVTRIEPVGVVGAVAATAPAAFTSGQWSLANAGTGGALTVTVTALPSDGGSAITALQAAVGAGAYANLGGTGTGSYTISGLVNGTPASVKIRAVNAVSPGPDSDTKTATPSAGATTDPNLTAIAVDGWRGTDTTPATLGDVVVLTPGFDASGNPITLTEVMKITARVRNGYPVQTTLTTDTVSFEESIYQGDVIVGVTNNSTLTCDIPQGVWLDPEYERITANTYGPRLCVWHPHARNGRPIAAAVFTVTDGVTTLTQTVTVMRTYTSPVSGLTACFFQPDFNMTLLAQGPVIFGAELRPWRGPAYTIPARTEAYIVPGLRQRRAFNDRGTYGTAQAYVTPGATGTPQVSTNPAIAAANPYATMAAAAAAIQTFNNATFGRNSVSGGIVNLNEGVHVHSSFATAVVTDLPLIIRAAPGAAKANTIVTCPGAVNLSNSLPDEIEYQDLIVRKSVTHTSISFGMTATQTGEFQLTLRRCTAVANGTTANRAWIDGVGNFYAIECDGDFMDFAGASTNRQKYVTVIGCNNAWAGTAVYNAVASASCALPTVTAMAPREGMFIYNCRYKHLADSIALGVTYGLGAAGVAVIGTLVDKGVAKGSSALVSISADGVVDAAQNMQIAHCTFVGQRMNFAYQDLGTAFVAKLGRKRFNIIEEDNMKSDAFENAADGGIGSGNRTGNWALRHKVGSPGNTIEQGAANGLPVGPDSWLGDIAGRGEVSGTAASPLALAFADDRRNTAVIGDYTPGAGSVVALIPAGFAPYPVDMLNRPYRNDGTGVAGAFQRAA